MGLISSQEHLTVLDQGFEQTRLSTWPGMAHFAGSGPAPRICRECIHWTGCGFQEGYYAAGGKHSGAIKPRACEKYRELMQGEVGPAVPPHARSCKYFSENANPPASHRSRG